MNYKIDYLLKYVSNETYKKIVKNTNDYILDDLETNRIDVDLNIRYLIKYGIKNIDGVILDRTDELGLSHNDFIEKVLAYEKNIGKDGFIDMIENL